MGKKTWSAILNFLFEFFLLAFIATVILELLKPGIVTRIVAGEIIFLIFVFFLIIRMFSAKEVN